MSKLLSASEIAALKLPGMPTTKVAILQKAKREGWRYEEATGIGGTRKLYDVPAKYLVGTSYAPSEASNVVGSIAAGSKDVDWEKMDLAMRALSEWEQERGITIEQSRRSAIISVLYDYLVRGEAEELGRVFKALG